MGGQELPDAVQDRPEQNAGYDAAVREGGETADTVDDSQIEDLSLGTRKSHEGIEIIPETPDENE